MTPTEVGVGTNIVTSYEGYAITFAGSDANVQEPTMTVTGSTNAVAPWENGTPSGISANTTDPFTLTQNQSTVLSVDSTTGFVAGNPITVGNISCLVTSVGTNTLTVTPESLRGCPGLARKSRNWASPALWTAAEAGSLATSASTATRNHRCSGHP